MLCCIVYISYYCVREALDKSFKFFQKDGIFVNKCYIYSKAFLKEIRIPANMRHNSQNLQKFILFCLLLVVAGVMFVMTIWSGNGYYTRGWNTNPHAQSFVKDNDSQTDSPPSNEPQAPGFRESERKKFQGKRFSTY